jgi:hypothetical protein
MLQANLASQIEENNPSSETKSSDNVQIQSLQKNSHKKKHKKRYKTERDSLEKNSHIKNDD